MRRQLAAVVAFFALLVIASGAVLTTLRNTATLWQYVHPRAGIGLGVLSFVLGIWCLLDKHPVLRGLGLLMAMAAGIEAMSRAVLIHACFAPVLFTAVACIAVFKPGRPEPAGAGKPSLRHMVIGIPPLVFLQIALGAAVRHKIASVMLHMGGALLVAGLILVVCVLVLQRYPNHRRLRLLATSLISIVLIQVSLGIAVFIMRSLDMDTSPVLVVAAAAHVSVGALTLAAGALLAIEYQRSVI